MRLLVLFFVVTSLFSCEEPKTKIAKKSANPIFYRGEWIDVSDTVSGISIRDNRIAYFENMKFTSDDINKYHIIDSISKQGQKEIFINEYLVIENKDSLKFKIIKRDKKIIVLEDNEGERKTFKFWR